MTRRESDDRGQDVDEVVQQFLDLILPRLRLSGLTPEQVLSAFPQVGEVRF